MELAIQNLWKKIRNDIIEELKASSLDESEANQLKLNILHTEDPKECLVNIFNVMKDLIMLKRNFFMLKDYDDFLDNNQYHESLQTLESEVRNHIKIQQQLRLFIETQQYKLEELEKCFQNKDSEIDDLIKIIEKDNNELSTALELKEIELKSLKSSSELNFKDEILKLKQISQRDSERIHELEQKTKNLTEN